MSASERAPINEIVIAAATGDVIAAFYANGVLARLELGGRETERRVGEIVLGRVRRVERDLDAAFVDIGGGRHGFINLADTRGRRLPGEGEAILVQISREAEAAKAAKLTAAVVLPGRTLLYRPGRADVRISRRIHDEVERERLRNLGAGLPGAGGWFFRRAALASAAETIVAEAGTLATAWRRLEERAGTVNAPVRLYRPPDPVLAAIAETRGPHLHRVRSDDPKILAAIRTYCPELESVCRLEYTAEPAAVDEAIEIALETTVTLESGGAIHFAETPALVAIDVDAGNRHGGGSERTALAANLEAIEVLTRHIGLRDLAGHLVIDFIGMRQRAHRDRVIAALRAAFVDDRQTVHVAGYTRLGKVELTRRRLRSSLRERLSAPCPRCDGSGATLAPERVAHGSLRAAVAAALRATRSASAAASMTIAASPEVIDALQGPAAGGLAAAERRLGRALTLCVDPTLGTPSFRLETNMDAQA